ncbi:MAG: hypothetical protein O3B13_24075 [Planctomycetota bacterium]|nr:hypothetical protein [Planctomycetota bacterium]
MARTSTEVVEKQMDAVSLLIEQSKDWRRCRRRWNTKSPQLIRQSELLERELARLLNVQAHLEKEGAELRKKELPDAEISSGRVQVEAERKQLEAQRDEVDCQLEELESAYRDHPFLDACERYAPLTGFGSDEIAAAANAGFDASRLPSDTVTDFRKLHDKLCSHSAFNNEEGSQPLSKSNSEAWMSFKYAAEKLEKPPRDLKDHQAYEFLRENIDFEATDDLPRELQHYSLPAFDAWTRRLREARRALGESKYRRGKGIETPSVRKPDPDARKTRD